jgi:hypothetical protein
MAVPFGKVAAWFLGKRWPGWVSSSNRPRGARTPWGRPATSTAWGPPYTLLTGALPFEGGHVGAVLDKVRHGEFRPPRLRKPGVSRALEAVCLKAMALKAEDRYATALDLAAEVKSWLADEPVGAWRELWTVRTQRWLRRHRQATCARSGVATGPGRVREPSSC